MINEILFTFFSLSYPIFAFFNKSTVIFALQIILDNETNLISTTPFNCYHFMQ